MSHRLSFARTRMLRIGLTLAVAGAGAATLAACSRSASAAPDTTAELAPVEQRDLNIQVEASGTIEPVDSVVIKSQASGEVLRLLVDTGDRVKAGSLLAEIDPRTVKNNLAQAQADLVVAQAQVKVNKAQLAREKQLLQAGVVTQQEYDQSVLSEANAEAQLVKAQNNLELAKKQYGDATIRAPSAGTILSKDVQVGQIIASATNGFSGGTTLMVMADMRTVQMQALVDETDIGRVQVGQEADVSVEAYPGRTFRGKVYKIQPQAIIDQNVTMFPVLIRLANSDGLLKSGMNAEVTVQVANRQGVLTVPNSAVVASKDAMAAAEVLGLNMDSIAKARRAAFEQNGGQRGQRRPGAQRNGSAAQGALADAAPGARGAQSGVPAECQGLREKIQKAGGFQNLSQSDRALLERCRSAFRGARTGQRAGGAQAAAGDSTLSGDSFGERPRPAVVFVKGPSGPEMKHVMLGVNNFDYTEILSGVKAGDQVYLMSVARIQQQQQAMQNRIRQRSSPLGGRR